MVLTFNRSFLGFSRRNKMHQVLVHLRNCSTSGHLQGKGWAVTAFLIERRSLTSLYSTIFCTPWFHEIFFWFFDCWLLFSFWRKTASWTKSRKRKTQGSLDIKGSVKTKKIYLLRTVFSWLPIRTRFSAKKDHAGRDVNKRAEKRIRTKSGKIRDPLLADLLHRCWGGIKPVASTNCITLCLFFVNNFELQPVPSTRFRRRQRIQKT